MHYNEIASEEFQMFLTIVDYSRTNAAFFCFYKRSELQIPKA
jgi:hypothetical protein